MSYLNLCWRPYCCWIFFYSSSRRLLCHVHAPISYFYRSIDFSIFVCVFSGIFCAISHSNLKTNAQMLYKIHNPHIHRAGVNELLLWLLFEFIFFLFPRYTFICMKLAKRKSRTETRNTHVICIYNVYQITKVKMCVRSEMSREEWRKMYKHKHLLKINRKPLIAFRMEWYGSSTSVVK